MFSIDIERLIEQLYRNTMGTDEAHFIPDEIKNSQLNSKLIGLDSNGLTVASFLPFKSPEEVFRLFRPADEVKC